MWLLPCAPPTTNVKVRSPRGRRLHVRVRAGRAFRVRSLRTHEDDYEVGEVEFLSEDCLPMFHTDDDDSDSTANGQEIALSTAAAAAVASTLNGVVLMSSGAAGDTDGALTVQELAQQVSEKLDAWNALLSEGGWSHRIAQGQVLSQCRKAQASR